METVDSRAGDHRNPYDCSLGACRDMGIISESFLTDNPDFQEYLTKAGMSQLEMEKLLSHYLPKGEELKLREGLLDKLWATLSPLDSVLIQIPLGKWDPKIGSHWVVAGKNSHNDELIIDSQRCQDIPELVVNRGISQINKYLKLLGDYTVVKYSTYETISTLRNDLNNISLSKAKKAEYNWKGTTTPVNVLASTTLVNVLASTTPRKVEHKHTPMKVEDEPAEHGMGMG